MFFGVAGRILLVDTLDDFSATAVARVLGELVLTPLPVNGKKPDSTIRIRCNSTPPRVPIGLDRFEVFDGGVCHTDGDSVYLVLDESLVVIGKPGGPEVDVWLRKHYDLGSWILSQLISQALAAALRRRDLFLLHSAGVLPPGQDKAILIAGESGCGKSTFTFQLASTGWGYLSDDVLLLHQDEHGIEAQGLRRCFALAADTLAALQFEPASAPSKQATAKKRLSPTELFPAGHIKSARPGAVLFPVVTREPESSIKKLTAYETMCRLLRLCPWACYDKSIATSHLDFIASLAREAKGFDVQAGTDLFGNPAATAKLVSTVY